MAVISRIIGGEALREDKTGLEATIREIVTTSIRSVDELCDAHNDPGTYDLGDVHPCAGIGLVCVEKATRPAQDRENLIFTIDYVFRATDPEDSAGGAFAMAGSLADEKLNRDRAGAQVKLTHTYPATYKDPILAGNTRDQIAEFEAPRPTLLLRWSRLQTAFSTAWANRAVLGKVNSAIIWGFAAEELLCTRMEIEQANEKYREIFEFQHKSTGWTVPVVFLQEDDNRPVDNPAASAEADVDVYPTYDYSLLSLTLPP